MKYKIVDNFLEGEDFDGIVDVILNDQEFYHVPSITGGENDGFTSYGFGCNFVTVDNPGKYQDRRNTRLIQKINTQIMMRFGKEFGFRNVVRSRLDLTTYRGKEIRLKPHTDMRDPHFTSILYFHTCGSPTIVYNETQGDQDDDLTPEDIDGLTEMMRVDSVSNRLFIFEGQHIHTGMCCYDVPVRLLLNSNFQ